METIRSSKLTDRQKRIIKEMIAEDYPLVHIAERFGISVETARKYK